MTSHTKQRTYTRQQLDDSRRAWDDGRFSDEWRPWRHLAAMQAGILFPPNGDSYDSWADAEPSERALLIRAIRETPEALRAAILSPRVHSWAAVIAILTRGRDDMAADVERREHDWRRTKRGDAPSRVGDVLGVLGDSWGVGT